MAYVLRVTTSSTSSAYCALNVNERTPVTKEDASIVEVLNTPSTTATLGGQLEVLDESAAVKAVPYTQQGGGATQLPVVGVAEYFIGPTPGESGQGRAN